MSDDSKTVYEALLAVQAEAPTLPKDKTVTVTTEKGGSYKYSYAPLDSIVEKIGPLLQAHGLVWLTKPSGTREAPTLDYMLMHPGSAQFIEGRMPLLLDRPSAQALGSAITYARRYALCAVLNLVSDDDDDGRAAEPQRRAYGGSGADPGDAPTAPQKSRITKTLNEMGATVEQAASLYESFLGRPLPEGKRFTEALTKREASLVIDRLGEGPNLPLPTGKSDVGEVRDNEFVHPSDDGEGTPLQSTLVE